MAIVSINKVGELEKLKLQIVGFIIFLIFIIISILSYSIYLSYENQRISEIQETHKNTYLDLIRLIDSNDFKIENILNYKVANNTIICLYSKDRSLCVGNKDGVSFIMRHPFKKDENIISYQDRYKEYDIFVGSYKSDVEKELKRLRISIIFSDILVLLLSGFLGYSVFGRFLTPVKKRIDKLNQTLQIISHDLRTPISIIDTNIYLLKAKGECKSNRLLNIERNINYIKSLIKNIDYLTEKIPSTKEEININQLIKEILEKYSSLISEKKLNITLIEDENFIVKGDYTDLEVLFTNIIDNGIKYNKEGGSLIIHIAKNKISVKNTGPIIKDKKKIFEKYYREENSGTVKGMGLGLSIVKNLSKTYNLKIDVNTENDYNEFIISKSGG